MKTGGPGGDALASRGIGFAPVKQTVRVSDSPVADINFQPIKATVAGNCREKCKNVPFLFCPEISFLFEITGVFYLQAW